jgi:ParB-like chromosome segregation protein Spo0J
MSDANEFTIRDLPLVELVPSINRKCSSQHLRRLEASLRAIGLIEPLVVAARGDHYEIHDGNARAGILQEMGVKTVPCIIRS